MVFWAFRVRHAALKACYKSGQVTSARCWCMMPNVCADWQAMAGSAYKDLALGDSVKVTDPIEELITRFGTGQPMVFQVQPSTKYASLSVE